MSWLRLSFGLRLTLEVHDLLRQRLDYALSARSPPKERSRRQPFNSCPQARERVREGTPALLGLHRIAEHAYPLNLYLDRIAVVDVPRAPGRPGHYDVAGLKGHHLADELDDSRHVIEQV